MVVLRDGHFLCNVGRPWPEVPLVSGIPKEKEAGMGIRRKGFWGLGAALTIGAVAAVAMTTFATAASGSAQHVRWDIIHLAGTTISAGGTASADAANGGGTITLTGSGTFVAPGSGGDSHGVTGGGTWATSDGASGTYTVVGLADWEFANLQAPVLIDEIASSGRSNGNAVLAISYSDGSRGVLTLGCHGPGAPPGIFEGITTTKGYTTYNEAHDPAPGVDANRTVFHIL
jgi:hypothetical protein